MSIYTDRIVLVFPITEKNRPAAASLQTLEIVNGREFETLVPLDPAAVAQYASEFNLPLIAERDQLTAEKAELEKALSDLTADRNKQVGDLASKTTECDGLKSQLTDSQSSNQSIQVELDATKASLVTAEARIAELLAGMPWDVRVIDAQAFVRRLSSDELLMLFSSEDATTQQIAGTIKAYVANDWPIVFTSPEFQQMIGYLVQSQQITEQRAAEITRDSTREESYVAG